MLFLITLFFSYLFEYGAYLQEQADQTQHIQEEMIMSFAEISENKSGQTGQHIRRVAEYTKILALALGDQGSEPVLDIYKFDIYRSLRKKRCVIFIVINRVVIYTA